MKREDCKKGMVLRVIGSNHEYVQVKRLLPAYEKSVIVDAGSYDYACDIDALRPLTAREKGEGKP